MYMYNVVTSRTFCIEGKWCIPYKEVCSSQKKWVDARLS